jgi:hypothetical protein
MRNILRAFLTASAIAATAIVGSASVAAAASPGNIPSFSERQQFNDDWCFDYGDYTDCTVQQVTMTVWYKSSGDSSLKMQLRSSTVSTDNLTGAQIGTTRVSSVDKSVYEDGFQSKIFRVEHTRYSGPLGTCISTYQLKVIGYGDVVVDRFLGPGCKD